MPKPPIAGHKFDLDLVFWDTRIIENFDRSFEGGTNCHLLVWNIFVTSVDTSIEDRPNIHQPHQFDLCQGHSSNRHFQWKATGFYLKRHI